ncbi:MAG: PHD finger protein 3 [Claussenomyces sp. TS43310]|nr:MAG: PHD finger protein 3 [Claussenomyces sp. TS43310]
MADEPRRSVRATKGQHTKSLDLLDQTGEMPKKRGGKKAAAAKKATSQEAASGAEDEEIIRCICGVTEQDDDTDEDWIACETCSAWQHNVCMGVTTNAAELENLNYWCEKCKPEDHRELLDGIAHGEKPWEDRRKAHDEAEREAQKAKKGKKGKIKKATEPKAEIEQNGKGSSPIVQTEVKQEKKDNINRSGSTKRKSMDDPHEEPTKSKVRKVSTPQAKASPKASTVPSDIPATIGELEKVRQGVAKLLHKNLHGALKVAQQDGVFQGTDAELDQRAIRLALEIERATHDTHLPGKPYIEQGRKLGANLKINQELCNGLVLKSLTPSAFATMTGDEMASKELQRQTAEMKARSDKQSIMLTEDAPRVRRTHKGDEIIEQDNFVTPVEDVPISRRRSMLDPNSDMGARSRENSQGDGDELPRDIDEYQSNDNIRANAAPTQPLNVDTRPQPPPVRRSPTQPADFDIKKVFSSVQQSPTETQHNRKPSIQAPPRAGPGEDADIDRLLEDGNESPPYSPAEYDSDPSIIWRGTMIMNGVATFPAVARHIGGADLSNLGSDRVPWTDLIPSKLSVAGRIDHDKASEYLCSLRYSPHTDIVVVALNPTGEAANDEFSKLFDYFQSKNRYGVVGEKGLANVRDTYLIPVPSGPGNVPEFMLNLENNKLPEERPEAMMLVALVIRNQPAPDLPTQYDGNASPSNVMSYPQRQMSIGGQSGPAISPIASQGSFGSPTPVAPGPPPPPPPPPPTAAPAATAYAPSGDVLQGPEAQRRQQRHELQVQGEKVAREILGDLIQAPTVSFLLPQAYQMQPNEWNVIKDLFVEKPEAQADLQVLSKLLEQRNNTELPK